MELQDQLKSEWSLNLRNQAQVEFNQSAAHLHLCSELKSSSSRLDGNCDPYCSIWTEAERARVKSCCNRSFAMDARMRLDSLKAGCNSPVPCRAASKMLLNNKDGEGPQEEESALDLVELLDIQDDAQDEENWLYESPKKQMFVEGSESALGWSRHVLDNPGPEVEAARRSLINKLDQRSSSYFYKCAAFHHSGNNRPSTRSTSYSTDIDEQSVSHDSITTGYRLQDITDVHIMARMQEASLRQDYASQPVSPGRGADLQVICPTPTSGAQQGCHSPKLSRLHQFKLLKRTQTGASSPEQTRAPLRTSLRSLQAVRNSRSLDMEDYQPADSQIPHPPSGASPVRRGSSSLSASLSAASVNSNGSFHSDRMSAVKRLQRSQSASPCRVPHPAKGRLSAHGRVFASPERSTTVAWGRNVTPTRRCQQ